MHTLPPLPYEPTALMPVIDAETMRLHHDKHHQAYIDKLNTALEKYPELAGKKVEDLLRSFSVLPEEVKTAVRNHGGGHANHSLFWTILQPPTDDNRPEGSLAEKVDDIFGGFDVFREKFSAAATGQFGSGWAWLALSGQSLEVFATANQDSPLMEGKTPIIGIDVWEHAYYLKYQNRRPEYIENFFSVINWGEAERRFAAAI